MFLFLKGLVHSLLVPPTGFLFLAVVAYGFLFSRWKKQATIVLGVALGLLWVLSMPLVGEGLWQLATGYPPFTLDKPVTAQAIVVIGGDGFRPHSPEYGYAPVAENELLERLTYAAYLAHRTQLPVAVSGDGAEARAMSATLARNLDIQTRWVESHSRDTFENALESAKLLRADGITHIILVTSGTHIWRATHEFRDAGFTVDPAPAVLYSKHASDGLFAVLPSTRAMGRSYEALYELIGEPMRVILAALHLRRHSS